MYHLFFPSPLNNLWHLIVSLPFMCWL
jgi:hypothetical protein